MGFKSFLGRAVMIDTCERKEKEAVGLREKLSVDAALMKASAGMILQHFPELGQRIYAFIGPH